MEAPTPATTFDPRISPDLVEILISTGAYNIRIEGNRVICNEPGEAGEWTSIYPIDPARMLNWRKICDVLDALPSKKDPTPAEAA